MEQEISMSAIDRSVTVYYRPQRSCGQGNIFTGICLATGVCVLSRGGGVWSGGWWSGGCLVWGVAPPKFFGGGIFYFFYFFIFWFFLISLGTPPPPPPPEADSGIWSTSGRYASYWNAFLLDLIVSFTFYLFMSVWAICVEQTNTVCVVVRWSTLIQWNLYFTVTSCDGYLPFRATEFRSMSHK